jgi:branched-chain amino acid transport system ATP-binding protein
MTVLLVEQNASLALSLADRLYILDGGRVVSSGTGADLQRAGQITRTYLGTETPRVARSTEG